ncbi:major facilitator superfamily domain-containing protein [Apodospora peruviana]|uniref:Major facilitator superfamily domain-containing protein n=1 Tax=Apodospora peruviana TaxID=516989 RepID=A0AAE0I5F7_9PEZI|nr:major facilitator superfamily domain-containing protein [Apodospora peruviana]
MASPPSRYRGISSPDGEEEELEFATLALNSEDTNRCDKETGVLGTSAISNEDKSGYVSGAKLAMITISLFGSVFLVALDRTIIATAVPRITSDFHSLDDISWYSSAYLITSCASQLSWGRIYTFYSTKTVFLVSVVVFEVGSALCGAAPTSIAFIIGRAIAGLGSAGIFSGATVIITQILTLHKRPIYIGALGSMFGVASIIGPLLGGEFTDHVTWRWCFYINLPIGAVVLAILFFTLHVRHHTNTESLRRQIIRLDPLGTVLFLPSIVCLLLALQWGGSQYPWNHHGIIVLFVLFGIVAIAFIIVQIWRQEDATIPPRIVKQRSVACGALFAMLVGGGLISMLYNLPVWFQAVKDTTAVQSGIDTIPLVLSLVVGTIVSGAVVTNTGYYNPWMLVSTTLMSVGAGLITTLRIDSGPPAWIGYQVLFGLGMGCGMQQPGVAAQTVLDEKDVAMGVSLMFFTNSLGGAVFSCIGQSLFLNSLIKGLKTIPGIDAHAVVEAGATQLARVVPPESLMAVWVVYSDALRQAFIVALVVSCLMVLPAAGMEWRNLKKQKSQGDA